MAKGSKKNPEEKRRVVSSVLRGELSVARDLRSHQDAVRRRRDRFTARRRWPVERTNSWLSNCGQLRHNTDRTTAQRLGQFALAITMIIAVKLFKWADRWNPT